MLLQNFYCVRHFVLSAKLVGQTWVLWRTKLEQILPVEINYFTVSGPSSFIHCHLFKNKFIFTFCEFSTQVL